ncbi:DsbA family oxidoreductase [Novispirillum sp. DQ9]|uniref:DsbA family oxidoreductase n=1 Tax=Novispirillum sp. DQ9 TaxID=3398612 RepID=UPI003C7974F7
MGLGKAVTDKGAIGPMRIEFIFDTVCPWCFVGLRRLERALARRPAVAAEIVWRPFLLNPDMPEDGIPRATYLERKFGGPARVARMLAGLVEAGRGEGIAFDFDAITRTPNSLHSHRLVRHAGRHGLAVQAVEAILRAYFEQGRDIGDRAVLGDIAIGIGLPREATAAFLAGTEGRSDVFMENAHTHRLSINGVPCFVFETSYGIAGAQDPDILVRMIDLVTEGRLEAPLSRAAMPALAGPGKEGC